MTCFEIVDGRKSGLWWEPADPGARGRAAVVRAIVLHWTGGTQGAAGIVRTLRNSKPPLSVHYTIEDDGTVTEHADPDRTMCMHAKGANQWTIGVEIAHKGRPPAAKRHPREGYKTIIHGHRIRCLRFTPAQILSAQRLCEYLARLYAIPLVLPKAPDGSVLLDVLPLARLETYHGVLGHLHVSKDKIDPGADLLEALNAAWTNGKNGG